MSVFLDAIDELEQKGWHQGFGGQGDDGEVCLVWAILEARNRNSFEGGEVWKDIWRIVSGVLPPGHDRPSAFNDDPSTSYEDVVLVLKRAHEVWEAQWAEPTAPLSI